MIVCCGEALIDMLAAETTAGESAFAPYAGGAIFNTAVALGRLGVPTGPFTGLSDDMFFGDILRSTLEASNVDFAPCATLPCHTTLAFVKLVDGHASYAFFDENTAGRMITTEHLPALGILRGRCIWAYQASFEPCGSHLRGADWRGARKTGDLLRSDIRPGFIKDRGGACRTHEANGRHVRYRQVLRRGLAWFWHGGQPRRARGRMAETRPEAGADHRGADGAVGDTDATRSRGRERTGEVVDTVGAATLSTSGILASLKFNGS